MRLTLLYGGLFLAAGALLLAVNYALVRRGLERQVAPLGVQFETHVPPDVRILAPAPVPGEVVSAEGEIEQALREFEQRVRDRTLHELVVQSGVALAVMALASIGLGWVIAGNALRPVAQMTATARRLSEANLHERLALQGPRDELKELADTFDAMLERLEAAFESQRRFVANASHELRTPLAIQRTLVDVALADPEASAEDLRATAVAVRDAVDRSERLIDGLLLLARSEQKISDVEAVDLSDVARQAIEQYRQEADERGITVEARLAPAVVSGQLVLLERLTGNLVQNAVRHNRDGGWITIETSATHGWSRLRVANSGAVVPAQDVPALFEPFRRLAPDRVASPGNGVGLGLSIVRAVTSAHGGSVRAAPVDGGGLSVTVDLPGARESASGRLASP